MKINWRFVIEKTTGILLLSPFLGFLIWSLIHIPMLQIAIFAAIISSIGLYLLLKDKV